MTTELLAPSGAAALAERFGTPAYVYDLAEVRTAAADLRTVLPEGSELYFSVKSNPHPLVGAQLAELGLRAEVSSTGEIAAALAAGFAPSAILMNGPGKSPEAVEQALRQGVRRFSVDSPTDLARVAEHATGLGVEVEYLLRVNADEPIAGMGLTMTGTASAFGADASWVCERPELFRSRPGARFTGLHLYMGTNIEDVAVLARQFAASIEVAARVVAALGEPLAELDLGGGFAMPYARAGARPDFPGLRGTVTGLLDAALPGWRAGSPRVSFESGRYLTGAAGRLLCRVLDVKESKGQRFVVLDTGIHHLGGMSGLLRVPRIVPDLLPVAPRESVVDGCTVAGPLCTPLDTWSRGVSLPELQPGDLLQVPNVGAYGLSASLLAFLGHPAPAEVVVDGGRFVSASRLTLHREPLHQPFKE
ncbi:MULTISPECIES: decarboxylase [Streptomyces]|uniref:decarboxylase n=1 Tax=Streptomyces TaxID=1883 RepID=UPI0007C6C03E|nr:MULTISPECIES: decarboxylase [Streptomyces]